MVSKRRAGASVVKPVTLQEQSAGKGMVASNEKKRKKEKKEGMMRFAEYTYADGPARLAADRVGNKKTTAVWSSHRKKNE